MNIIINEQKEVTYFEDLNVGDVFQFEDSNLYFLKLFEKLTNPIFVENECFGLALLLDVPLKYEIRTDIELKNQIKDNFMCVGIHNIVYPVKATLTIEK